MRKITKRKTTTRSSGNSKVSNDHPLRRKASNPSSSKEGRRSARVTVARVARTTTPKRAVVRRASPRAVPVATALKSLIPASVAVSRPVATVRAETIHQPVMKTGVTPVLKISAPVAPLELMAGPTWRRPALGLMTAMIGVMALAFFVHPNSAAPQSVGGGRILGLETTQPLRVSVMVNRPTGQSTVSTVAATGTLAEALGRASSAIGGTFSYVSRGSSIYLSSFSGLANNQAGHWDVRLNGAVVSDLSQTPLSQGDQINVTWQ